MALVLKDRVKETCTSPGTGTVTLLGASAGYSSFSTIGNANTTYYCISDQTGNNWEVGIGTYTSSGSTLSRDTIISNSLGTTATINFSSGSQDVFCTYPAEKAIYEEPNGDTLINAGPITVLGPGTGSPTPFTNTLGRFYGNVNNFQQLYLQNQNSGSESSADLVAYNNLGDGSTNFIDMGINSSNYSSATYPIFTAGSGYLFNDGGPLFIGSGSAYDVVLFAGGVGTVNEALRINATTRNITTQGAVSVGAGLGVTGAATFGSTVLLNADPTIALQAATKSYVDQQVTAGIHIHNPVRVETTANLNAAYVQGGTTFNITTITTNNTVTTSVSHGLAVNDQIWLTSTAGNGLSTNTAYFVYSTPAANQLTLSLTYGGAQITSLTNASGLTYATRANSGVGATLTNSGAQAALILDGVTLSVADRVMVRLQTTGAQNGVYVVTNVGSGSTNWILTRATDANKVSPSDPDGLGTGDYFFTQQGTLNAGDSHVLTTEPNTMIIGYTTLTYTQFSGAVDYTGGTNIDVTGQVISLTGTVAATNGGTGTSTVTTGNLLYGSATNTWSKLPIGSAYRSLVVNGSGTQVEWNGVALNQTGAVSGSLPAINGGTGLSSYATGDLIYSSATNTLANLAGNTSTTKKFLVQTGTGSASSAPTWGSIVAGDVPTLNQNTTGSAGSVANALTAGTGLTASATYNGSAAITFNATGTTINSQTGAYVLTAADAGKTISITTGGVTIPASVLAAGNIVTIYNNSASSQTITQGAGLTLQWAGQTSSTTGNRTLALYGMATLVFISATNAVITGAGLT